MKSIIKTLLAIAAGISLLASCAPKDPVYAKVLSTDVKEIKAEAVSPQTVDVKLTADGEWYVYSPAWIKAEPETGNGDATVKITINPNTDSYQELNAPRKDVIAFCGAKEKAVISVFQKGEQGLASERKYSKISKAEEFEIAKGYLIVFNTGTSLVAAAPLATEVDNPRSYAFMPVGKVSEVEGIITVPNGKQAFYFEKTSTEGINYMRQSDGSYPWQAAGYDNFYRYSAANVAKSGLWKITFAEDGHAKLDNTQRGADGFLLMFDGTRNSIGTYTGGKQNNKVLPYLYKDAAEPSKEILSVPGEITVLPSATTAEIKVEANCKWSVRNHDSWITKFEPSSGDGDGTVKITFDTNKTGSERKAEFLFIGEETNVTVTLRQVAPVKSITELNKWVNAKNTIYELEAKDVKVSYVNENNFYLEDENAGILLYSKKMTLVAGNVINGTVSGNCTLFNALPELTSMDIKAATVTAGLAPVTELTLDALNKDYNKYISRKILIKDVEISDGVMGYADRDGKIKQGEIEFVIRSNDGKADFSTGSKGEIVVFPAVRNNDKQLSVYKDSFKPTFFVTTVKVNNLMLMKGRDMKINLITQTSAKPSFKSKDESIATVTSEGIVSGVSEGKTNITVTYPAQGIYSAAEVSFEVTVFKRSMRPMLGEFVSNLEGSFAITEFSNASLVDRVVISKAEYFSLILGVDNKSSGFAALLVPKGTRKIGFYAAAWKNAKNLKLTISTKENHILFEKKLRPYNDFTGSSPYDFGEVGYKDSAYYYEIDLGDNIKKDLVTRIAISGGKRGVVFGINASNK